MLTEISFSLTFDIVYREANEAKNEARWAQKKEEVTWSKDQKNRV